MVYTVIYSGEQDDIPVLVFSDKGLAEIYAAELFEFYESEVVENISEHHADVSPALDIINRDCSTYSAIAIATHDANGKLVAWDVIGVDADDTQLTTA